MTCTWAAMLVECTNEDLFAFAGFRLEPGLRDRVDLRDCEVRLRIFRTLPWCCDQARLSMKWLELWLTLGAESV